MAKLTAQQKANRKTLRAALRADGGDMFTYAKYGITIAVCPAIRGKADSKFVYVSIAQCDMETDMFKRKYGELLALMRMSHRGVTTIPRNGRCNQDIADDVLDFLLD